MKRGIHIEDMLSKAKCLMGFTTCIPRRDGWVPRVRIPHWSNRENFSIFEKRLRRDALDEWCDFTIELLEEEALDWDSALSWFDCVEG
jgi:hypothetical protein